ncbi:hypothetical protein AB0O28_14055 [Microbispora sp. NPDC088329]|uniref:hypothetical protein n=1 Tax=Microbispora sp. NPDC088329 TaxID=3154869 RepID=UPI0034353E91
MTTRAPAYASPSDVAAHGPYGPGRTDRPGPLYPFRGRITADGSSGHPAEPGRYRIGPQWSGLQAGGEADSPA